LLSHSLFPESMRQTILSFFVVALSLQNGYSQVVENRIPDGGGAFLSGPSDQMDPAIKKLWVYRLKQSVASLRASGVIPAAPISPQITYSSLRMPLKRATAFTDSGYYAMEAFMDHNPAAGQLRDFNCGTRTWEYNGDYNHTGTDINIFPFPWTRMNDNSVEVVAAAAGYIIEGNGYNRSNVDGCDFTNCQGGAPCEANQIFLLHDDGTVGVYLHMKRNTITTKAIGARIEKGEYLGIVGSSGRSRVPHLHFEIWQDTNGEPIDPWMGTCNTTIASGQTMWETQEAYRASSILKVMTHGLAPVMAACPENEQVNVQTVFVPGNTLKVAAYYRDNISGQTVTHRVYDANNDLYSQWTQTFTSTDNTSFAYYNVVLPVNAIAGSWRYEASYAGYTKSTNFIVTLSSLPLDLLGFEVSTNSNKKNELSWEVVNDQELQEYEVERGQDGRSGISIGKVAVKQALQNSYKFTDEQSLPGIAYYRLKMVGKNGAVKYSKWVVAKNGSTSGFTAATVSNSSIQVQLLEASSKGMLYLRNSQGQVVKSWNIAGTIGQVLTLKASGLASGVYLLEFRNDQYQPFTKKVLIAR